MLSALFATKFAITPDEATERAMGLHVELFLGPQRMEFRSSDARSLLQCTNATVDILAMFTLKTRSGTSMGVLS